MTPGRWQQVRDTFAAALEEAAGAARASYLDRACAGDPELRAAVESMLTADAVSGSVLDSSPSEFAAHLEPHLVSEPLRRQVGPYRIVRELGRGGMGTVYLAEREDVAKRVALKVVRGLADRESARRFLLERRVLARLAHANIASLLDAGVTDDGTPWFAMEYVDGESITEHADRRRLGVSERLALFTKVCAAVSHAHRHLLVHRDVKPSNILVSGDGEPKLLDFGIAKLLGDDAGETLTATGVGMMTPEYAAPEQLRGEPATTATDVHALGLLLYELLTGQRAIRPRSRASGDLRRVVLDVEPVRPSSIVVRPDDTDPASLAHARSTQPAQLRRRLRGDLDAIVLRALRKNPLERYASVDALADDLERHRLRLPVLALRGSRAYRARRFIDRNRGAIAAAVLALLVATAIGLRERVLRERAERARDDARIEAAKAQQATDFLVSLFDSADPFTMSSIGDDTLRLREYLLMRGQQVLSMQQQPDVKLQVLNAVGRMYYRRGVDDRARPVLDSAVALARRLHPEGHVEVVRALHDRAEYYRNEGSYAESERDFRDALAVGRRVLGERDVEVSAALTGFGELLRLEGKYASADSALRAALEAELVNWGRGSINVGHVQNDLGLLLWERGRYDEAEPILREALATLQAKLPPEHPEVTATENNLGLLLSNTGRAPEAEPLLRTALDMKRRALGPDHPRVANALSNLASALLQLGRLDESERDAREAVAIAGRAYGERNVSVATYRRNLAQVLLERGELARAEREARSALSVHRALLSPTHQQVGRSLVMLGRVLVARGRAAEALPLLEHGDATVRESLGDQHAFVAVSESALGECLAALGRSADAEPMLRDGIERFRRSVMLHDPAGRTALGAIVRLYESAGRSRDAEAYRSLQRQAH